MIGNSHGRVLNRWRTTGSYAQGNGNEYEGDLGKHWRNGSKWFVDSGRQESHGKKVFKMYQMICRQQAQRSSSYNNDYGCERIGWCGLGCVGLGWVRSESRARHQ
jgi:hypothetical protein